MAVSMSTTNVKVLGPAVAKWGAAEATMGHTTDDGFEFKYTPTYTDVKVDVYGETVINKYLVSEMAEASFILAQYDPEVLELAIPFGTYAAGVSPPLKVGDEAGGSGLAQADKLILRPWINDVATPRDEDDDIIIYKAFCSSEVTIPLKFGEQAKIPVTFTAMVDTTKDIGNVLFGVGRQ